MRYVRTLATVAAVVALGAASRGQTPERVDFRRDVQPIFAQHCIGCHGPTQQMNGLRLDRRRDAMRGGTIPVIGPGNSAGSRLYHRITGNDFGRQMPPTAPLPPEKIAVIKAWLDQGAEWPDEVSGETPRSIADPRAAQLMTAIRAGDGPRVNALVDGAPEAAALAGDGGSTPLQYAALYGDAGMVRRLLEAGADPNRRNDNGATALMWIGTDVEKAELLLDYGADPDARSGDSRTPLLAAAGLRKALPVVTLLLDYGANPSAKAPSLVGDTCPLTEAALSGDPEVFRLLVERGADLRTAGVAALAFALHAECTPCVETLLKSMPPPAVTVAALVTSPPTGPALATPMLVDRGADPRAVDPDGHTLLMLAAASEAMPTDTIRTLLNHGADVNARARDGLTAEALAARQRNPAIIRLLGDAGAAIDGDAAGPDGVPAPASSARAAVMRALPLLQRIDTRFLKSTGCVSCHSNSLSSMAVVAARAKHLPIDEVAARQNTAVVAAYLEDWRDRVLQGHGIPGNADTISYLLVGLGAAGYAPDPATDAMAMYLKRQQVADGHWRIFAHRPPIESSDIQVTATTMHALQLYAPVALRAEYDKAIAAAGAWLAHARPTTNEDRAFRLLGLKWSGARRDALHAAAVELIGQQRPDGGWAQLATLDSDAYATGQALVALSESGELRAADPAFARGAAFLRTTQLADGSWHVRTRALPIQPAFESGFPHGRDQFISNAATDWAAMALVAAAGDTRPASRTHAGR